MSKREFDMDRVVAVLTRAFDLGVNYVDTAETYSLGKSEIAVGRAVKGRREDVFIATKYSFVHKHQPASEWRRHLEGSLRRLDIDSIDFYHLHNLQWRDYRKRQAAGVPLEGFRMARDEGLIGHLCFSSHDEPGNIAHLIDSGEFAGMLVQYNLLDRRNEEVIGNAHDQALAVAIMSPVGGGALAEVSPMLLGTVSGARSTPDLALRFVLANPHVTTALSGVTTPEMVEANIASASREEALSDVERRRLGTALDEKQRLANDYCCGCGECMPCPQGVDMPANLTAMNFAVQWGLEQHARSLYRELGKGAKRRDGRSIRRWAEACTGCAECEARCPQDVPIVERLRETASALSGT